MRKFPHAVQEEGVLGVAGAGEGAGGYGDADFFLADDDGGLYQLDEEQGPGDAPRRTSPAMGGIVRGCPVLPELSVRIRDVPVLRPLDRTGGAVVVQGGAVVGNKRFFPVFDESFGVFQRHQKDEHAERQQCDTDESCRARFNDLEHQQQGGCGPEPPQKTPEEVRYRADAVAGVGSQQTILHKPAYGGQYQTQCGGNGCECGVCFPAEHGGQDWRVCVRWVYRR